MAYYNNKIHHTTKQTPNEKYQDLNQQAAWWTTSLIQILT
jgi:hypothetical protein